MRLRLALLTAFGLALPASAPAQVVWDSPLFAPPRAEVGYGLYLIDPHGAELGLLGTYKGAGSALRFRLGIADGQDDVAILGGVDYSALLRARRGDFPLDIGWGLGVGAGYEDWLTVSVPLALSVGLPIDAEGMVFTPFLGPRVVLDARFDAPEPIEKTDLELGIDLGLDLAVSPTWGIRFAVTLGDREALGIGIVF